MLWSTRSIFHSYIGSKDAYLSEHPKVLFQENPATGLLIPPSQMFCSHVPDVWWYYSRIVARHIMPTSVASYYDHRKSLFIALCAMATAKEGIGKSFPWRRRQYDPVSKKEGNDGHFYMCMHGWGMHECYFKKGAKMRSTLPRKLWFPPRSLFSSTLTRETVEKAYGCCASPSFQKLEVFVVPLGLQI